MLNTRRQRLFAFPWLAVAPYVLVILLGVWIAPSLSATHEIAKPCTTNEQNHNHCATKHDNPSILFTVGDFASRKHDAIEAISGALAVLVAFGLTVVTAFLWGATRSLAASTTALAAGAADQVTKMDQANELAEKEGMISLAAHSLAQSAYALAEKQLATSRAQFRAFVFLEELDVENSVSWPQGGAIFPNLTVVPRWKNSGVTPTRNLELRVTARQWDGELPDGHDYFYQDEPQRGVIGPNANEWSEPQIFSNFPAQIAADGETITVYVWGEAKYLDVFEDVPRFTQFCYRMRVYDVGGGLQNAVRRLRPL